MDDDNDGCLDDEDDHPFEWSEDFDGDGNANDCDNDDDGDTILDLDDVDPLNPFLCLDLDDDSCDDCSVQGNPNSNNDGYDYDGDGLCDVGDDDDDDDNLPDQLDSDDNNEYLSLIHI